MKYMVMMFGSAEGMVEQRSTEWIRDMMQFMADLNRELTDSGELVFSEGLEDPSTAKVLDGASGSVVVTDGPFAESKESIIGYWILEVADEPRILELVGRIATKIEGPVEIRRVGQAPEL
jgi:hypothetical protein